MKNLFKMSRDLRKVNLSRKAVSQLIVRGVFSERLNLKSQSDELSKDNIIWDTT
jgi:hypothetical protein